MISREEYEKTYIRMMDSLRRKGSETNIGSCTCAGVPCKRCPLDSICNECSLSFMAFAVVETVEKWGKDHPIVTYADKYKEVFGIDATDSCPARSLGLVSQKECDKLHCGECKEKYWNLEYVEPKRGDD